MYHLPRITDLFDLMKGVAAFSKIGLDRDIINYGLRKKTFPKLLLEVDMDIMSSLLFPSALLILQ